MGTESKQPGKARKGRWSAHPEVTLKPLFRGVVAVEGAHGGEEVVGREWAWTSVVMVGNNDRPIRLYESDGSIFKIQGKPLRCRLQGSPSVAERLRGRFFRRWCVGGDDPIVFVPPKESFGGWFFPFAVVVLGLILLLFFLPRMFWASLTTPSFDVVKVIGVVVFMLYMFIPVRGLFLMWIQRPRPSVFRRIELTTSGFVGIKDGQVRVRGDWADVQRAKFYGGPIVKCCLDMHNGQRHWLMFHKPICQIAYRIVPNSNKEIDDRPDAAGHRSMRSGIWIFLWGGLTAIGVFGLVSYLQMTGALLPQSVPVVRWGSVVGILFIAGSLGGMLIWSGWSMTFSGRRFCKRFSRRFARFLSNSHTSNTHNTTQ